MAFPSRCHFVYICAFLRMLSVKEGDCGEVSDVKIDYTKLCIKFGT